MSYQRYTNTIRNLNVTAPFIGPEAQERQSGILFKARLGANESVFGPSPKVISAIKENATEIWKYCDPENYDLRHVIAEFHGVSSENVVITEGIDGGLGLINRLLVDSDEIVVTSQGAYPTFNFHVAACGGRCIKVPYKGNHEDIYTLLEKAKKLEAKMLYLSNPDNPMGTWWPASEIEFLIKHLPGNTTLVLDEAYCDTAPHEAIPAIDISNPMVLRFRTFSKAYGLAGARIGYCIAEASVISKFDSVRNHYGINRLAQIAAVAAINDQDHLKAIVDKIAISRARIADISHANGLIPIDSGTNFVAVDLLHDGLFAQKVIRGLLAFGVFVRMPSVAPLNRCIRISAGTQDDLDLLEVTLPKVLSAAF
ncbi:MAG TPA: Histidinol-phosphate aminotransferase [Hyphomicrobiaceae bacterium MAG_BT-2024]